MRPNPPGRLMGSGNSSPGTRICGTRCPWPSGRCPPCPCAPCVRGLSRSTRRAVQAYPPATRPPACPRPSQRRLGRARRIRGASSCTWPSRTDRGRSGRTCRPPRSQTPERWLSSYGTPGGGRSCPIAHSPCIPRPPLCPRPRSSRGTRAAGRLSTPRAACPRNSGRIEPPSCVP